MFCFWRGYLALFARGFDHNFRRFVRMQNLRLDNIKLMKRNKFANARHVHETSAPDYTCTPFAAKFFQPPLATTCFFCSLVLLVCCTPCFASVFFLDANFVCTSKVRVVCFINAARAANNELLSPWKSCKAPRAILANSYISCTCNERTPPGWES